MRNNTSLRRAAGSMLIAMAAVGLSLAPLSQTAAQSRAEARDDESRTKPKSGSAANAADRTTPKTGTPKTGAPKSGAPKSAGPSANKTGAKPTPPGAKGPPGGPGAKRRGPPPMFVGVDKVRSGPLQQTSPVVGRIVTREGGVVAARTPGPVAEIRVHVGDRVKKGDVLAVLVGDLIRAEVERQRADLRLAKQKLERLEKLRTSSSAAFQRALYDDRIQEVAAAQARLRVAELALKYSKIVAPFDGVVTKRHTDAGAFLARGAPVVTMVNDQNLEIEADVPADRIAGLLPGAKITFETIGRKKYSGTVRAIVPEQNPMTRTLAVRITPKFSDTDPRRAINQSVTVDVPVGSARNVVSVAKDGVIARGGGHFVMVVMKGRAVPRPIVIGDAIGSRFVVNSGLRPGDIVIVRGNERVRPGQPVTFRKGS